MQQTAPSPTRRRRTARVAAWRWTLAPFVLALSTACNAPQQQAAPAPGGSREPYTLIEGFVLDRSLRGELDQRILAKTARYDEWQKIVHLDNVSVEFFNNPAPASDKPGEPKPEKPKRDPQKDGPLGKMWADRGVLYMRDTPTSNAKYRDMDLEGNVQYRDLEAQNTLIADRLRYSDGTAFKETTGTLSGEGRFRKILVRKEDGQFIVFDGEGFTTNRALKDWFYTRSNIKSMKMDDTDLESLRPAPRADAPGYVARN